jgi:hypothetical protein
MPDAVSGGQAVFNQLSAMVPKRSARNTLSRFKELERTSRGRERLDQAGVSASTRTQLEWLAETRTPSARNRRAIDEAYRMRGRDNMARRIGREVEVYPDPETTRQSLGAVRQQTVSLSPAQRQAFVAAWQAGDVAAADTLWNQVVDDQIMDSPPGRAYHKVSHVWFGG